MRITELLKQESIGLNEKAENKEQAIQAGGTYGGRRPVEG